jgi:REP element-mobilizing transposase RayT
MANTYTQIYVQIVFAVQGRANLIKENFRDELEKYMCGIIKNNESKPLAIYCNPDHVHILIGLHPATSVSTIAGDIKANSSKWINKQKFISGKFSWQVGYGAFTYSKSHINNVAKYILGQPEHHKKSTFKDEYLLILQKLDVDYSETYLFEWID